MYGNDKQRVFLAWLFVLILWPSLLMAQEWIGGDSGHGKGFDGSGAGRTTVHIFNKDNGQTSDTTANDVGFYSAPGLFPGNYSVTFSVRGMQRYEISVVLQVAQTAVISPSMSPGSVTQQVTVTGDTIQLATYDSGTISSKLDNKRINQHPMNGRNILTLTGITTPGLEAGGTRANGNMAAGIEYVLDGAPLSDRNFGGPAT